MPGSKCYMNYDYRQLNGMLKPLWNDGRDGKGHCKTGVKVLSELSNQEMSSEQ